MKHKIPTNKIEWSKEIISAYLDAAEAKPFAKLLETKIDDQNIYLLAPLVCLKFRGLKKNDSNLKRAQEAAYASVIATEETMGELNYFMKFSLAYIASHLGLELIEDNNLDEILDYIEENKKELTEQLTH